MAHDSTCVGRSAIRPAGALEQTFARWVVAAMVGGFVGGCDRSTAKPAATAPLPVEVTVSKPLVQEVTEALEFTGATAPTESVDVRPRVAGFLERVHYQAPAKVKQGDLLFTIDSRPFKNSLDAKLSALEATKAHLVKAEFDATKLERLRADGQAAEDEYVKAISTRDALRADISRENAEIEQAKLELGWCQVTAPISGRISRNQADPGNIVQADTTVLAKIVSDETIYLYFDASERDVLMIRERGRQRLAAEGKTMKEQPSLQELKPPVFLGLMTEKGYPHEGVLDYSAPEVDTSTGTIQVRGRFANTDGMLLPGLFVRVRLPISKPAPALVVTERALGLDQEQRYVLTVNARNVVEYRPAKVGVLVEGMRVIEDGLRADEWVIVNGLQRVRPGVTVAPQRVDMATWRATTQPASAPATRASKAESHGGGAKP
jgi:membrane fusion protein, multidrug efflux system